MIRTTSAQKRLVALVAAIAAMLLGVAPGVLAQEADAGPTTAVVHRVDATENPVQVVVMADSYGASEASIRENGKDKDIVAETLRATGLPTEVVFVIDTSQRLGENDMLDAITTAVAREIRALPSGTSVAVVDAASSAILVSDLTRDLAAAARAVESLDFSQGGLVFNGVDRASAVLSESAIVGQAAAIQTVVVVTGGPDAGSSVDLAGARAGLIRRGAQVVAIQVGAGEPAFNNLVRGTGGLVFGASTPESVDQAVTTAVAAAGDRYVFEYEGVIDPAERGDVTMRIGSATTAYSYSGGELTIRSLALGLSTDIEPTSIFSFFETQTGLYVTLLLAFLGLGLLVFMLGITFAGGESSLEGLISRYSSGDDEINEEESNLVQTALVQRAVELSESFAEERGFLGKVEELLERARLPLRPGEAMSFYVGGIFLGSVLGFIFFGGLVGALILGFIVAVGAIGVVRFMARRRMRKFEKQLPDTLQLLAGTLRAGYSLPQGLEAVSKEAEDPMGYELSRVMTEARLGRELEEALSSAAERLNSPDFAWAVMAISIQREVGGNLNELLMTVSDTMIARERLKGEVATLTAEGKMSAILLGGLPPGLGFVMWIMNREYIDQLFTTFLGNVFLGMGIVASLIGLAWMKKVITIDV